MTPIPETLLEQVERGNVLLFIGERVARNAAGQAVVDRLIAGLTDCHVPATTCLDRLLDYRDRHGQLEELLEHGLAPSEISGILSISRRLVDEYIEIVKEHHPQIIAQNPHLQEQPGTPDYT